MKKTLIFTITCAALLCEHGNAQTLIAGWDFQTTATGGTAVAASTNTPTLFNANFGSGTLYLNGSEGSSTWLPTSELNAFSGATVNASNGLSTTTTSPAALALLGGSSNSANGKSAVFKFDLTGFQDLSLTYAAQRTSTGFNSHVWEWSTDGLTYNPIGTISAGTTAGTLASGFATSGILGFNNITGLDNAATAYVRVTFSGATASAGNNRLDNFQFNASTYVAPTDPAAWFGDGVTAGGSGTWSSVGNNWSTNSGATVGALTSAEKAVFGTTGGTVTIAAGGVSADSGIDFEVDGYTVTGGTLTLGGTNNQISVAAAATANINSSIAGANGFAKLGSGILAVGGSNAFTGNVTVSAGALEVASDSALGDAANDLVLNGTLKTSGNLALGAGRDVSGSATFDLAPGSTLTVNGAIANTATTLVNASSLDLQGSVRTLGALTLNGETTLGGSGAIAASSINASNVTTGTVAINQEMVFGAGDAPVSVGAGGTIDFNSSVSNGGAGGRLLKTGAGTLILGANNTGGVRVGSTGGTPTEGGTVILENSVIGTQAQSVQLNAGTLSAASDLVFSNGISIGGRTNGAAVLAGSNMEFQGASAFFRGASTSGELVLNVNNSTTFSGGFNATSGSGTATGITIGGTGEVFITGASSALVDTITLTDTVKLTLNNTIGGGLNVGASNVLGGNGAIGGSLSLASGAKFVFSLTEALTVNGPSVSFGGFGIADLIGLDSTVANGAYTIIDGLATVETANLSNLGVENAFDLGEGKSAYFSTGSLVVNVVPEPSTYALLTIAAAGLGAHIIRRRRR